MSWRTFLMLPSQPFMPTKLLHVSMPAGRELESQEERLNIEKNVLPKVQRRVLHPRGSLLFFIFNFSHVVLRIFALEIVGVFSN